MKKRLFVLVLALAVVFTFSAVPGFAASKQIVQVSEKSYYDSGDGLELSSSWKDTYKNGKLQKYTFTYISRDYNIDDDGNMNVTKSEEKSEYIYTYKNGRRATTVHKENGKTVGKTVNSYKNKKISKITDYNYENGSYKKASVVTYKYTSKKTTITTKYVDGTPEEKEVLEFNSKGRLLKETSYKGGKKTGTWKYTYWDNGNDKKCVYETVEGDKTVMEYNKKGLITKDTYTSETSKHVSTYKYNSSGLVSERTDKYTFTSDAGDETTTTTYTYKYSKYYNSNKKYPQLVKIYEGDKLIEKEEKGYKKI